MTQTSSVFDISLRIASREYVFLTMELMSDRFSPTWSKSMQNGSYDLPQSRHGASFKDATNALNSILLFAF